MTTASIHPPKPRRRGAPSERDQHIYLDYQTTGRTQADLAADHGLTQCRISQIIRRVEKWLADEPVPRSTSHVPSSGDEASPTCNVELETCNADRQRLDSAMQLRYMSFVCREAIRQFQADRLTITTKKGSRGETQIDETTERREPKNLQCLKIILQAIKATSAFSRDQTRSRCAADKAKRTIPEASLLPAKDDTQPAALDRAAVESWILENRNANAKDFNGVFHKDFARDLVNILLGEPATGISLNILAGDFDKVLVPKKKGDQSFPPGGGWYRCVYDEDGQFLRHERVEGQTAAVDSQPASDIPESGADIPVCQDGETESWRDRQTDSASGLCTNLPPSSAQPPTAFTTITTCAPTDDSSQTQPPQKPPPKPARAKISPQYDSIPHIAPDLRPLYDKILRVHQMRVKGLPFITQLTAEEEGQLYRLPLIFLEES
jgi:hypothetical protein